MVAGWYGIVTPEGGCVKPIVEGTKGVDVRSFTSFLQKNKIFTISLDCLFCLCYGCLSSQEISHDRGSDQNPFQSKKAFHGNISPEVSALPARSRREAPCCFGGGVVNKDIRIDLGFFDHRKTRKLVSRFGLEAAWGLLRLWAFAARDRPSGVLAGMTAVDVAMEMRVSLDPDELVGYMTSDDCRWLDMVDGVYSIHGWSEHNPWAAGAQDRSDASRFSRMAKTHPQIFKDLQAKGVRAVSTEEYQSLTKPQRIVNAALSPAPSPAPKSKDMSKPKKLANPSVRVLQEYLVSAFEKRYGVSPVMNYAAIGKQLLVLLDRERFTEDAIRELIDWFLTSPKAGDHPTPAAAISVDTVQRWQIANPEVK